MIKRKRGERQGEREKQREIFINRQGWVKLKSEARNSIQVSHVDN